MIGIFSMFRHIQQWINYIARSVVKVLFIESPVSLQYLERNHRRSSCTLTSYANFIIFFPDFQVQVSVSIGHD
jgi:hypothetical protein